MRSLLSSAAILVAIAGPALAAPAHVQSFSGNTVSAASVSFTLPTAIASGDTFVGAVFEENGSNSISSIKDDKGNTYTLLNSIQDGSNPYFVQTFALASITNSPRTITVTFSAAPSGNFQYLWGDEYSGVSAIDTHNLTHTASGTSLPSGSVTLSGTNDELWTMAAPSTGAATVPSGYTLRVNDGTDGLFTSDLAFTGTGAYGGASYTNGTAEDAIVGIVGLIPAGASPKGVTYSPPYGIVADTAASGATVTGFVVTMSDSSTYNGMNSLLFGSDALCTIPASGNGNITLSRTLTSADAASQHTCKLQVSENGANKEVDFTFNVEKAVEFGDTSVILPSVTNGQVLGVANGAFAMIQPSSTIWNGTGAPSASLGGNGDFYIDTQAEKIYGPKASGSWPSFGVSLVGPTGAPGAQGPMGQNAGQSGLFTPTSSTMACQQGQSGFDTNYLYFCVASNQWGRFALTGLQTSGW